MSKLLARFLVQSACLVLPLAAANTPASQSITIFVKGRSASLNAMRKVLAPAFVTSKRESWNQTMGRAMGRVFTHELFHMLAQSKAHHNAGVSKSCFSVADLTSDRFAFDSVTVAQLRPNAVEDPV